MSIKRHVALQPFSREHVVGLFHAHQLMWLSNQRARFDMETTVRNFRQAWIDDIAQHFAAEEITLSQLNISSLNIERLLAEHKDIKERCAELFSTSTLTIDACFAVGHALEQHIRWEEHFFFPEIEQSLSEAQLDVLGAAINAVPRDNGKQCS